MDYNSIVAGFTLPPPPVPKGLYRPALVADQYVYVSGHGPAREDGSVIRGRAGLELTADEAKLAARQAGLSILSTLKNYLEDLNKIRRVIKVFGMVNSTPEFDQHPYVVNGCSELFREVFGAEDGVGVRSAVGMSSLPGHIAVEIEAVFQLA